MNKDKTFQGKWFLPNKKENSFSGTFSYTRDKGCNLEIFEYWGDFFPNSTFNIILGETLDGGKITLVDCSGGPKRSNMNGVTISRYFAGLALIGDHYENLSDLIFDDLLVSISDLEKWIGIYGLNILKLDRVNVAIDINFQLPKKVSFEINDDLQVYFDYNYSIPIINENPKAEISQTTLIGIKTSELVRIKELLHSYFKLYKFISFSYFDSPHTLSIKLKNTKVHKLKSRNPYGVELLYFDNFFKKEYKTNKENHDFLFHYQEVRDSFHLVIKNWFVLYEKITPAVDLLNELLLKREYPLEFKFLSAVQAVETFHRNIFGGERIPKNEYKQRIKVIIDNIPDEFKVWLKAELAFSNEPKLKERLSDLIDSIPVEITSKLIKDKDSFIKGVVDSRNYYTHYSSRLKEKKMSNSDILSAIEKLKILLICSILNGLQFSNEKIVEYVSIHKVYPYADL